MSDKDIQKLFQEAEKAYTKAQNIRKRYADSDEEMPKSEEKKMDRFLAEADRKSTEAKREEKFSDLGTSFDEADESQKVAVARAKDGDKSAAFMSRDQWESKHPLTDKTDEKSFTGKEINTKTYPHLPREKRDEVLSEARDDYLKKAVFRSYLHKAATGRMHELTDLETKTLNTLKGDEGGYVTDMEIASEVIRVLNDVVQIRDRANVMQFDAPIVHFPTMDVDIDTNWVQELTNPSTTTDEPFGKTRFDAESIKGIMKVSEELFMDSVMNIEGELGSELGREVAQGEEAGFIKGTGDGQPLGLIEAGFSNPGIGSGSDNEFLFGDFSRYRIVDIMQMEFRVLEERYADEWKVGIRFWKRLDASPIDSSAFVHPKVDDSNFDDTDIIDVIYALKKQYRQNASFLMHRNTIKEVRKMTDDNGRFQWQPGLQQGEPARLGGFPLMETEFLPDPDA